MTNISHRAIRIAAATAFLMAGAGLAGSATAATVFSDNFDGAPSGSSLNAAPTNWSVVSGSGSVDWINNTNAFGAGNTNLECRGDTGGCVDLDGSTDNAGIMTRGVGTLLAGTQYLLTAYLSGNQRGANYPTRGPDSVKFGFLDSSGAVITNGSTTVSNVAATQGYTLISWLLTPDKDYANASVFFEALGGDNVGPLLDDVTLTAVPLPAAAWLLLSGLAGFAALGRRRARVAEA